MKGLLKRGTLILLIVAMVFTLLVAPVAVQAGEKDIPRTFSIDPITLTEELP